MKYLPFLTGTYSTAPGLTSISKAVGENHHVFQVDDQYMHYLENKQQCRKEGIEKYYIEHQLLPTTINLVNRYIVQQLLNEHPEQFTLEKLQNESKLTNKKTGEAFTWGDDGCSLKDGKYLSLFDALCCQVQEDIAVWQLNREDDYLSAIHLCSPNHWAPSDKIGKPFHAVHAPVPGMERTLLHYQKMLASVVNSTMPFTRFAWGMATDTRLNHHPEPPAGTEVSQWEGRVHNSNTNWYIRSERQNLIGFPEANAFMFTIRTYFYAVQELAKNEKNMLLSALKSMTPETLQYKGLTRSLDLLLEKLN